MDIGMSIDHGLQFIEHGGYIPRHADLIGLGMVGFSPHFLQYDRQIVASLALVQD
jgi:hypothetical protein